MSDTVNGSSCSYTSLSNYNSSAPGTLGSPAVKRSSVSGSYVVPNYSAIGYDALTHNNAPPSCNGYFNISNAYGADAGSGKTNYRMSPCNQ